MALLRFWFVCGHAAEGLQWLEATLTTVPTTAPQSLTPAVQAAVLNAAGVLVRYEGDYRRAAVYSTRSLELWRTLADGRGMVRALHNLAAVVRYEGDDRQARQLAEESLVLSRALADNEGSAAALNCWGFWRGTRARSGAPPVVPGESGALSRTRRYGAYRRCAQ